MEELILGSKEIFDKAVADFKPKAVVLMLSGGDDSMTTYEVGRQLGIKFNYVIHGNTRTGIPDTTEFVRKEITILRLMPEIRMKSIYIAKVFLGLVQERTTSRTIS